MIITSEILAAYAEGKVSGTERDAIRNYLADNPSELQSLVMMMDEDYDLDVDVIDNVGEQDAIVEKTIPVSSAVLCCSAAAFAPGNISERKIMADRHNLQKDSFDKRLDDFIDDLGI